MPKKRIGDLGDFKIRGIAKPPRIGDRRENIRFSFEIPKDGLAPPHDCALEGGSGSVEINPDFKSGRESGYNVLYDADQIENYRRNYPRFARGLDLIPSGIARAGDTISYQFCSNRSKDKKWTASIEKITVLDGTYLDAGGPLYIICPIPYIINTVDSDGSAFKWTKLPGGRPAQVLPDNIINPELIIFDAPGVIEPIQFKVEIAGNPDISDVLTIYTQPIDKISAIGFEESVRLNYLPCREIPCALSLNQFKVAPSSYPPPIAYLFSPSSPLPAAWGLPACDVDLLQEMVWQSNTTGTYLDIASFALTDARLFQLSPSTHYRIKSIFEIGGIKSESYSCTFYFAPESLGRGAGIVGADGIKAVTSIANSSFERFNFGVARFEGTDNMAPIYYGSASSFERLALGAVSASGSDRLDGISHAAIASFTKLNLGGVIIG